MPRVPLLERPLFFCEGSCPSVTGFFHAAFKAYSVASCVCAVLGGMDGGHTYVILSHGQLLRFPFHYVLKQTSDEDIQRSNHMVVSNKGYK